MPCSFSKYLILKNNNPLAFSCSVWWQYLSTRAESKSCHQQNIPVISIGHYMVSAKIMNLLSPSCTRWRGLLKGVSACDGVFHRSERTDTWHQSLLIYILLFRSHASLTPVTPPAGLSKPLSGLMIRLLSCWTNISYEREKEKKVNGCKINYTFWTNENWFVNLELLCC